jgi:hypothetical protein
MFKRLNHRRGLKRLWLVATLAWLLAVALGNAVSIATWAGYHYGLLQTSGSFRLAVMEKERMRAIVAACWAARRTTCVEPPNPYDETLRHLYPQSQSNPEEPAHPPSIGGIAPNMEPYKGCEQSPPFVQALAREGRSRDIVGEMKFGAACTDLYEMEIPDVNWALIVGALLTPLVPVVMYLIGAWVLRGFSGQTQ